MKKLTILLLISFFMIPALTLTAQEMKTAARATAGAELKTATFTPETFQENAENMVGKEVDVKGMVIHVCKHGGKKMFLIGEDPDIRIKITTSDKVSSFNMDLEGSIVSVKGIVEPMDEVNQVMKEADHEDDNDHKNYYHRPQYSISCLAYRTID
ncbi:MAG: hypothetical protein K0B08_01765 [Bacteroidales bacterium]|nr:hypothetical protein [Bacteroidales bacterium]